MIWSQATERFARECFTRACASGFSINARSSRERSIKQRIIARLGYTSQRSAKTLSHRLTQIHTDSKSETSCIDLWLIDLLLTNLVQQRSSLGRFDSKIS